MVRFQSFGAGLAAGLMAAFVMLFGVATMAQDTRPAVELVMFEQSACSYCELWNEQVGTSYDKTAEGRTAPLRRIDIHEAMPADLTDFGNIALTPTFVLLSDGKEVGRMPGYLGEDFFWGYLTQMLADVAAAG